LKDDDRARKLNHKLLNSSRSTISSYAIRPG
jgi:hypothetical protein